MRFLYSGKYRREVLVQRPCRKICKVAQSERSSHAKMQVNFPSKDQIGQLKSVVGATEIKLSGGKFDKRLRCHCSRHKSSS